jgi:hypothetical protein
MELGARRIITRESAKRWREAGTAATST